MTLLNDESYRELLASLTEGVVIVDASLTIRQINPTLLPFTLPAGTSDDEPRNRENQPWDTVFPPESYDLVAALQETIRTGNPAPLREGYLPDRNGELIPVRLQAIPLRHASGSPLAAGIVEDLREVSLLRRQLERQQGQYGLIGKSPAMQRIRSILPNLAESDSTILIEGPAGSGKSLLAQSIHDLSTRQKKPFAQVLCGALPDTLLEPELFGVTKGALPGVAKDRPGQVSRAKGGTLFLKDIAAVSTAIQIKLLRLLQEKVYDPIGSRQPAKCDARLIVSTLRPLSEAVQRGVFREDLYYRLNVIRLTLPPLLERREDIPMLAHHLLERLNAAGGKTIRRIDDDAMALLLRYSYPGNVRELGNILEYAAVLSRGETITADALPPEVRGVLPPVLAIRAAGAAKAPSPYAEAANPPAEWSSPQDPLEQAEAQTVLSILAKHNGNRTTAAVELGIDKSTLWRKMKKLGIDYETKRGRKPKIL